MAGYIGKSQGVTQVDGYNRTEADDRYVNASGDTMTGGLIVSAADTNDIIKLSRTGTSAGSGYIYSNQNETFGVHNGAGAYQLMVDSAGRVTMPYQPAFYATNSGGTVAYSNSATFGFNLTVFNRGSHFNGATGRFTAPVSGVYCFSYNFFAVSGPTQVVIELNGSDWVPTGTDTQGLSDAAAADGYRTRGVSVLMSLSEGDYVSVGLRNGFATSIYMGHTHFSGYLIG